MSESGGPGQNALAARILARRAGTEGPAPAPGPVPPGSDPRGWTRSVNPAAAGPALFMIPGLYGSSFRVVALAERLGSGLPCHALEPPSMDWAAHGLTTMDDMARHLEGRIRALAPAGPYRLLGQSSGGNLAFEVATRLQEAGAEVPVLVMLDTDFYREPEDLTPTTVEPTSAELAANAILREGLAAARTAFHALRAHRPARRFAGGITYFYSTHYGRPPGRDRRLCWAGLATGGLELHPVPARHEELLAPEDLAHYPEVLCGKLGLAPPVPGRSAAELYAPVRGVSLGSSLFGSPRLDWADGQRMPVLVGGPDPGHVDVAVRTAGKLCLQGWARDPECPAPSRAVVVLLDGLHAGAGQVGRARPDVAAALRDDRSDRYGFTAEIELEPSETTANRSLRVFTVGDRVAAELSLSGPPAF